MGNSWGLWLFDDGAQRPRRSYFIGLTTLVAAWLLVVFWRFVFVAPPELYQELEAQAAALRNQLQTAKEISIERDVWLTDAVYYICLGEWVKEDPNLKDETRFTGQTMKVAASLKELRQAAIDDEITIWGWSEWTAAFIQTDASIWKEYELEWMSFLRGRENMRAEAHPSKRARIETLTRLKTSQVQIQKLRQNLSSNGDLRALEILPPPPMPQGTERETLPKTSP